MIVCINSIYHSATHEVLAVLVLQFCMGDSIGSEKDCKILYIVII